MITILFRITTLFRTALCAVAFLCVPEKNPERRLTRRDGQAASLAAALTIASFLLVRYAPQNADNLLILGGLVAPPLVAAVAGRRFIIYGFLTLAVGLLFWIAADYFSRRLITDLITLFDRYSFPAVMLGLLSLGSCYYLKQYMEDRKKS